MNRGRRKREITKCIFCGRSDLGREHIWPVWSREYVRKGKQTNYIARTFGSSPSNPRIRGERSFKERPGDVTNIQLKVVCKKHCNSGWMSRLETRVKPILIPLITGRPITMNRYNQEIVATWIAMKFMVCEFSNPESQVMPATERSVLMGRRLPPDIMKIWIGNYRQATWSNGYARFSYGIGIWQTGQPFQAAGHENIQCQSLVMGQLFIHAVTVVLKGVEYKTPRFPSYGLSQLWPFEREFHWPPPMPITDAGIAAVVSDLDRIVHQFPVHIRQAPPGGAAHR